MRVPHDLPQIVLVRIVTSGGPYRCDEILSVAYTKPNIGRVVAHDRDVLEHLEADEREPSVPETIEALVVRPAPPYAGGERITLSFVDPSIVRVHSLDPKHAAHVPSSRRIAVSSSTTHESASVTAAAAAGNADSAATDTTWHGIDELATIAQTPFASQRVSYSGDGVRPTELASYANGTIASDTSAVIAMQAPFQISSEIYVPQRAQTSDSRGRTGVRVRLAWTPERVRRFVQVVDKLFTIDRLGWYRHVFAMRLLVPDDVTCGDSLADIEAMRHLHALRAASVETLGRPLLAAFMPNFSVTAEWLTSLDNVATVRAVAALREAMVPYANESVSDHGELEPAATIRSIVRGDLVAASATSVEGLTAMLVPTESSHVRLTERLNAYRETLVDVFGQTARSAEAVRLNQMTQPNHSLDDRLWQLVGAVGEAFDGLAVA